MSIKAFTGNEKFKGIEKKEVRGLLDKITIDREGIGVWTMCGSPRIFWFLVLVLFVVGLHQLLGRRHLV